MALWQKLVLLFTVIWVGVGLLNAATILALADEAERGKAWTPILLAIAVPPLVYGIAWSIVRLRGRGKGED